PASPPHAERREHDTRALPLARTGERCDEGPPPASSLNSTQTSTPEPRAARVAHQGVTQRLEGCHIRGCATDAPTNDAAGLALRRGAFAECRCGEPMPKASPWLPRRCCASGAGRAPGR